MDVLVLGSEGLVGTSLCNALKKDGYTVIHWDLALSIDHDLSNIVNIQKLKHVIDKVDFIFFLAYDVGGAKYISDVNFNFINRNIMIMFNTFNLLENKKFIFTSSTMYNMESIYGTLKHVGEQYTSKLGGLSVRFWNVYGPEPFSERSHVITDMIHKWKKNGYIDLMTTGEEERQFLHTDDCAKCLITVMKNYNEIVRIIRIPYYFQLTKDVAKFIFKDLIKHFSKVLNMTEKINQVRLFLITGNPLFLYRMG